MKRVALLFGGISAEREVSLASGRQVLAALAGLGYAVTPIEVGPDLPAMLLALRAAAPDVVFNALHGRFGEDGVIQGILAWMGLAVTHSPPRASALAMDKVSARAIFREAGLPVASGLLTTAEALAAAHPMPCPYVVKPVAEGSSVGIHIVRDGDNRRAAIAAAWTHGDPILIEEFIPGRELTVGVLAGQALTVTEIAAAHDFYDYDSKYAEGGSRHAVPAAIPDAVASRAMAIAVAAHAALGCRGATRADFRYDDTIAEPGRLVLLEVNTQPGLTQTSLLPEQAAYRGMDFPALCAWMVEQAARP